MGRKASEVAGKYNEPRKKKKEERKAYLMNKFRALVIYVV
jgi:hypothetical protein